MENLQHFLALLEEGFTHVWMLQDTFALSPIAGAFAKVCQRRRIRTALYYPVDAPMDPEWTRIIASVDLPVAYGQYGLAQTRRALAQPLGENESSLSWFEKARWRSARQSALSKLISLPHGVETAAYRPLPRSERESFRGHFFAGKVSPSDFVILNVSAHQRRKGLVQTLMVFQRLREALPTHSLKLAMHMPSYVASESTDLRAACRQLGLGDDEVLFSKQLNGTRPRPLGEEEINQLYNAADLLVTTSYGEGWGLPLTEAMAAGLPVAGPRHTSIAELLGEGRGLLFETDGYDLLSHDNSRLRPRTDIGDAARKIAGAITAPAGTEASLESIAARGSAWARGDFLDWDRIADKWISRFFGR